MSYLLGALCVCVGRKRIPANKIRYWNPIDAQKPLPPPPPGLVWIRTSDGMFELLDMRTEGEAGSEEVDEFLDGVEVQREFAEHVVLPSDTLAGIRLRYGVSATDLRRCNAFQGDNFRTCTILKIPLAKSSRRQRFPYQSETREVVIQRFRNATGLGAIEAGLYLDEADWQLQKAIASARADDAFESSKVAELNSRLAPLAKSCRTVVIHVESASRLKDSGILMAMDVYIIAYLWDGTNLLAQGRSCVVRAVRESWRWCPTQKGSTIILPIESTCANLALSLTVMAPNELMPDTHVGSTKRLPLKRLVDGAVHAVGVDTGGELSISIAAPDDIARDAVRAVAIGASDENPFLQPIATDAVPVVTAVAVRADELPPAGEPPQTGTDHSSILA